MLGRITTTLARFDPTRFLLVKKTVEVFKKRIKKTATSTPRKELLPEENIRSRRGFKMKLAQSVTATLAALFLLAMQGCGGGDKSTSQSAPRITTQPTNVTVQSGQTATFTVAAVGSPAPTFQWLLNGAPIAGATAASYTTATLTTASNGSTYSVSVSNAAGSITSNSAMLTVTTPPSVPVITTQPASATVQSGQTATLTVVASGSPTPVYQWALNGTPIAGATSASYTTAALTSADSGATYSVTASNSVGAVTSNEVTVTVSNVASATLAAGVVLLTPAQEATIVAATASSITFSQSIGFGPGTVVLGANHVFKVVSSTTSGAQTVLTVTDPGLGELFTSLIVQGSYTADPSMAVPAAASRAQRRELIPRVRDSGSASDTFSWPFTLSDDGFSVSSTLTSTIGALVDYSFQDGTLQHAILNVSADSQLTLNESFSANTMASTEQRLGIVTIPINVSVLDASLNSLGIYTLALQIPIYAGVSLESGFQASLTQSLNSTGAVNLSYDPTSGPQANSSFGATYSDRPDRNNPGDLH